MQGFVPWAEQLIRDKSEARTSMPIEFTYWVHTHPSSGSLSPSTPRNNALGDRRTGDTNVSATLGLNGIIVVKNKFSVFIGEKPLCTGTW
jgi:hypothetical protein